VTDTTRNPRGLRRAVVALTALVLLVAATAGLGTGSAAAKQGRGGNDPHFRHGHNHIPPFHPGPPSWTGGGGNPWPGGGSTLPGAGVPVPGQDTSLDPTELQPPPISVLKDSGNVAPGSIFVAPKITTAGTPGQQGPEIVDNQGRPIFFQPVDLPYQATDFRVQQYRGQPVLTYDVGQSTGGPGHSSGEDVILDQHYRQIATVSAGNGLTADQHEFRLTSDGTALITSYHAVPYDLSPYGGPVNGQVYDGVAQEIDIATGKVVFQWDSLSHVPLSDSYIPVPTDPNTPWDYFHINAVNPDTDGNLLISGRGVSTIYKIDHQTGAIIWRLGGKESDFQLGPGVQFVGQHNALPETGEPNTIRIFDNGNGGGPATGLPSRVIDVKLDTQAKTATLVSSVQHPDGLIANSQGNAQRLPGGHLFVGWGSVGRFSEFDSGGNLLWDGQVPAGYDTYRAYRSPWVGEPTTDPTAEAQSTGGGNVTVNAIWNGATEVDRWLVLAGSHQWNLSPVGSADWNGLDTAIAAHTRSPYVEVVALDDHGHAIGRSQSVQVSD
jgi:hypothetical protein